MKPRISMVSLGVKDLEVSRAFYEDGLGLPRMESPPGIAFYALDGTWLGLAERDALAADAGLTATGSGFAGITLSHNVASEDEVDYLIAKAVAAGAQLIKEPTRASWGGYHGHFRDPDGHVWEIAHNPFLWIGPGGPEA